MLAKITEVFVLVLFVLFDNVFQGCVETSACAGEHASGSGVKERGDESCYDVFHFWIIVSQRKGICACVYIVS